MTRPTYKARTRTEGDYGKSPQAAALRLQLAGLAALERTPLYQELCAAADGRVRSESGLVKAGNGRVTEPTEDDPYRRRTHGKIATYKVGCRCDECRTAAATARAEHRAKQAPPTSEAGA